MVKRPLSPPAEAGRRRFGLSAALAILTLSGATLYPGPADAAPPLNGEMVTYDIVTPSEPAPAVEIRDGDGNLLTIEDFAGRVVVMNFWATWCAPCVHEMPSLDRLQAALGDRGLDVVAVSLDRGGVDAVLPFFDRVGLEHLGVYLDEGGRVSRAFGARGLPYTVVLDAQGRIVGRYLGPAEWDSEEAIALMEYYLQPGS